VEEAPYRTSGVEQFFLPELPNWANFSAAGECFKSSSLQYMDFSKIFASYQLSYESLIELQAQYNDRRENYFQTTAYRFLKPVEEASFFSNTLEQVRAGVKLLKLPNVPEVEIIWLESFTSRNKLSELKKIVSQGRFDERLPILFSSCLSRNRLTQFLIEEKMESAGFYLLSAEFLSPFNSELKSQPMLRLELAKFLGPGIRIKFFNTETQQRLVELIP
jgi:hypothetical protein